MVFNYTTLHAGYFYVIIFCSLFFNVNYLETYRFTTKKSAYGILSCSLFNQLTLPLQKAGAFGVTYHYSLHNGSRHRKIKPLEP